MLLKPLIFTILSPSVAVEPTPLNKPELRETIERAMRRCGVLGMAIAVLHKNELVYAEEFGKCNKDDPHTVNTVQPISLVTKSLTATVVGELVAEGKVDWDTTPVTKYLPEFKFKDPTLISRLTFHDMLSHRTGIPNVMINWHNSKGPRRELIRRLRFMDGVPRKLGFTAQYNNIMYAVVGEAVANVAGTSYEDLVLNKVIRPLGLKNTGFSQPTMRKLHPNNYAMPYEAVSYEAAENGEFRTIPLNEIYMSYVPAGDAYSNVLDMVRWRKTVMVLGKVDGKQVLNDGATIGYASDLIVYPNHDPVITSTTNILSGAQIADSLSPLIAETLLDLLKSNINIDWIEEIAVPIVKGNHKNVALLAPGAFTPRIPNKPPTFPNNLRAYVGVYSDPQFGTFVIGLEATNTTTSRKDDLLTYKYTEFTSTPKHYHYNSFVATLDDPMLRIKALITFSADPVFGADGKDDMKNRPITRMQIQELPAGLDISKKLFKKREV
ncbi:hypothetical protein BGW39_003439 [Mortierella sp. 14UC]|nr:hypothetical protein BGW39_003439 [Mortierella sp. 14UC]